MTAYLTLVASFLASLFLLWCLHPKWYANRAQWGWTTLTILLVLWYWLPLVFAMTLAGIFAIGHVYSIRNRNNAKPVRP